MTVTDRDLFLARLGFVECKDCLSWVRSTKEAVAFHYRRCKG